MLGATPHRKEAGVGWDSMSKHAPPTISSAGARVIASGTVIPFDEQAEVAFEIGPPNGRLAVIFRFEDGPGVGPESKIQVTRASAPIVRLVLRNFGDPNGEGTVAPLKLGVLEGLTQYVHFRVFRVGTGPRTFHYTFFESGDISLAETLVRGE
jgi:hypothetical protein